MPIPDVRLAPTRHMFVRLRPDWGSHIADDLHAGHRRVVADWVDQDFPLVVARNIASDPPDLVRLGLSLPDKMRIAMCVDRRAIRALERPPPLDAARRVAPPAWYGTIDAVLDAARRHDICVRTYGSLAWQALTSQDYLRPSSDLDLLLAGAHWPAIECLSQHLQGIAGPPRLDGEALLPDGAGIAWREIARGGAMLLVKTQNDVLMSTRAAIVDRYADRAA